MKEPRTDVLVVLSAPVEIASQQLAEIRADHQHARLTIYLRETERQQFGELINGCHVCSDKPSDSKTAFLSRLRTTLYDEAIVLDYGQWSRVGARCLFFLARARTKTVRSERGNFRLSPVSLLRHWLYRRKHRSGSVAGLPPGTPAPFLLAAYRKTLGLGIGLALISLEYGWRRLFRASG